MEKPKTTQRMVDALWYAVFGMNEKDGMLSMVKALWDDRQKTWTRSDHYKERNADEAKAEAQAEERKAQGTQQSMSVASWISSAVAIGALIVAVIAIVKR